MKKPRENTIKRVIDDLYNIFLTELHLPFMNFMGPNTNLKDRISLNYDVRPISKGTSNYMIPTSESDYYSFIHDLFYYAPNDKVKFNADLKYLKDIKGPLGFLGIGAQFLKRGVMTIGELGFNLSLITTTMSNVVNQIRPVLRERGVINITKKIVMPLYIFYNYLYPQAYKSAYKSLDNLINQFVSKKEYNEILPEVNKVKNKLDKYLDTVGKYKPITSEKSEKYFVVNENIDTEKSKKAYEELYNQVVEYFDFINNKYKDTQGYKQVVIPPLNMDNIEDASNPKEIPRTIYEKIIKTINDASEEIKDFFNKYSKEDIDKLKEKQNKEEIEKVLKGYIDVPFETPIVVPPEEQEPEIEIDFADQIPEGMTVEEFIIQLGKQEAKEYDEEIIKVLKGEQDVMFETPVYLTTPIEIIKGLSKGSVIETPIPSENLVATEQPEFMDYDFEAMNNMVEVEIQPTPSVLPYMYYGMDAI